MGARLRQVQRFAAFGDGPGQPLAHRHPGDMHRRLVEAAGGEQFQHPLAQEVDGTHLAIEVLRHELDHPVELFLRMGARSHDLAQIAQDGTGGGNGTHAAGL